MKVFFNSSLSAHPLVSEVKGGVDREEKVGCVVAITTADAAIALSVWLFTACAQVSKRGGCSLYEAIEQRNRRAGREMR